MLLLCLNLLLNCPHGLHRNLLLIHTKRLIHLLLMWRDAYIIRHLPLALIVWCLRSRLVAWLLHLNWNLRLLVLMWLSYVAISWLIVSIVKLLLVLVSAIRWLARLLNLFLFKFVITMSKRTFSHIRTGAILEVFTKFSLIVSTILWDKRFIAALVVKVLVRKHTLVLWCIITTLATWCSLMAATHLHTIRILIVSTTRSLKATSSTVIIVSASSSSTIIVQITTPFIWSWTLEHITRGESLVCVWHALIVLVSTTVGHRLSVWLESLVLVSHWATASVTTASTIRETHILLISTWDRFF